MQKKELTNELTNERLTIVLGGGMTQKEASKFFGVSKVAISKRVKRLVAKGILIEEKVGSIKLYEVNQRVNHSSGVSVKPPLDSGCVDIHDIRGNYIIKRRGVIPRKFRKMGGGYQFSHDMKNCYIQVTKGNKIKVRFKKKYMAWAKNRVEAKNIKNWLMERSNDYMREFCERYNWDVDFTNCSLKNETKVKSDLRPKGQVYTDKLKMVYPVDGEIEGDVEHIAELIEGTRQLHRLPTQIKAISEAVVQLQDVSVKMVEVLGKIEETLKHDISMKPSSNNSDYIG